MEKKDRKKEYKKEAKRQKEQYGRLEAKLPKDTVKEIKKILEEKKITYRKWLEEKIKEEIKKRG